MRCKLFRQLAGLAAMATDYSGHMGRQGRMGVFEGPQAWCSRLSSGSLCYTHARPRSADPLHVDVYSILRANGPRAVIAVQCNSRLVLAIAKNQSGPLTRA